MLSQGLVEPGPIAIGLSFGAGFLTSLGPCSLSLLPVTVAFLAGFENKNNPFIRSFSFCSGIILSLVLLGSISGVLGRIYGNIPSLIPIIVGFLSLLMGLNLIGIIKIPLPAGPDPKNWGEKVPNSIAPIAAGFAFGLASSPCTTPVLAVLLAWIAQSGEPLIGAILLASFGAGQVLPLFIAGSAAAQIPNLLALRKFSRWIPLVSGVIFITTGTLTLLSRFV
tara:strand:+ start:1132 stop:1800 length:669 start_codon:yes stop_codon:yes gene_type:complete